MSATIERVKVEILLDAPLVDLVARLVEEAGASGHTLLPALGGSGRSGSWNEDRISAAETKVLLLVIAKDEIAAKVVRRLEPLLDTYGMIVMTSRVWMVRDGRW